MTPEEFNKLLKPENPQTPDLENTVQALEERGVLILELKGENLLEVLNRMLERRVYPLVDKKLRIVFGLSSGHQMFRSALYLYHAGRSAERDRPETPTDQYLQADQYLRQGMGYFFSSMNRGGLIAGHDYREDRFDKDVFLSFPVQRQNV